MFTAHILEESLIRPLHQAQSWGVGRYIVTHHSCRRSSQVFYHESTFVPASEKWATLCSTRVIVKQFISFIAIHNINAKVIKAPSPLHSQSVYAVNLNSIIHTLPVVMRLAPATLPLSLSAQGDVVIHSSHQMPSHISIHQWHESTSWAKLSHFVIFHLVDWERHSLCTLQSMNCAVEGSKVFFFFFSEALWLNTAGPAPLLYGDLNNPEATQLEPSFIASSNISVASAFLEFQMNS